MAQCKGRGTFSAPGAGCLRFPTRLGQYIWSPHPTARKLYPSPSPISKSLN